jgi:hypothetical protein
MAVARSLTKAAWAAGSENLTALSSENVGNLFFAAAARSRSSATSETVRAETAARHTIHLAHREFAVGRLTSWT